MKGLQKFRNSRELGLQQESLALSYLQNKGLELVKRNYRSRWGEIDLIMLQPPAILVFVEVRFRKSSSFGSAKESITRPKQQRIKRTAAYFLLRHKKFQQLVSRFDVVAVATEQSGETCLDWIQHAFY